jgi:RNA polymerase sigma-70 factor (ECF subfamily)
MAPIMLEPPDSPASPDRHPPHHPLDSTADLLLRARSGDESARTSLFQRYQPVLTRFAHRRLPANMRDLRDTDDLVQQTLVIAFKRLDGFVYRREGGFLAYLRQICINEVFQEIRRHRSRPPSEVIREDLLANQDDPFENVVWEESQERYARLLNDLDPDQREGVVMRLDFGLSYAEIAHHLGRPTANAARMLITRAIARLARSTKATEA